MNGGVAGLVERGDLDELTGLVNRLCASEDWDGLMGLRDRCRAALQRGKQLWPVAAHAEYRLALEAPGRWAARVLEAGTGRFTPGPLTEVAASTHTWDELAPHAPPGPVASLAAHERVVRGEDLRHDGRVDPDVLELGLALEPWEPPYPVATYEPDRALFPAPGLPPLRPLGLPAHVEVVDDGEACRALVEVVTAWTTESNGRAEVVAVRGDAAAAVAALGVPAARAGELTLGEAMAHLAWAGASGGAHGRRRGMAFGRFASWWALAAVTGLVERWPLDPAELAAAARPLRWMAWDAGEPGTGWLLRLVVEDPRGPRAWALSASDAT